MAESILTDSVSDTYAIDMGRESQKKQRGEVLKGTKT